MQKNSTCCFTGHRDLPEDKIDEIRKRTKETVERLIDGGFVTYICGGAVGFDMMCGEIVLELKEKYPQIELFMAIPCAEQSKFFGENAKKQYMHLMQNADRKVCLSENYYNGCMQARNRYMVDNSAVVIAYCTKNSGGTFYTCCYAKRNGKTFISVAK